METSNGAPVSPFACAQCKARKLKCDRIKPGCKRCINSGDVCRYPTQRKRPVTVGTRLTVSDLEIRLMQLEGQVAAKEQQIAVMSQPSPVSGYENALISTGRLEQLPSQAQTDELVLIYFGKLHSDAPILHQARYIASLHQPAHMQPPMCLQYALLALAANASRTYRHVAEPFYNRARQYMATDEMKDDGHAVTLAHVQAWLLLCYYEARNFFFSRAALSASKAVRLSQILGLHLRQELSGPESARKRGDEEERVRTLWAVFCTDRGSSSTTGWPVLMDKDRIQTRLPASEESHQLDISEMTPTLHDALNDTTVPLSSFALRVIALHLFHECFDFQSSQQPKDFLANDPQKTAVAWARSRALEQNLTMAFSILPPHLQCPESTVNSDAVVINLQLHTARIFLYRASATLARQQRGGGGGIGCPRPTIDNKVYDAAESIMTIVATVWDIEARFRNQFVAFGAYVSAFTFLMILSVTGEQKCRERVLALLDLMIAVGHQNQSTAVLAIQLAKEIYRKGVDDTALTKVQRLIDGFGEVLPTMGEEDTETGHIVFCPFQANIRPLGLSGGL